MYDPAVALSIGAAVAASAAVLFWPDKGLVPRWHRVTAASERIMTEDALKYIQVSESEGRYPTVNGLAGTLGQSPDVAASVVRSLSDRGLALVDGDRLRVTPQGRDYALQVLRAHRLYERFLADETGFRETEWHGRAERHEHRLSPEEVDALAARLGNPTHDPHGDPIPDAAGHVVGHGGRPLTSMELDVPLRIVHVEDEPPAVYSQLVAEGLRPGMEGVLTELGPNRVRLWADGDEHVLAPIVAANIHAVPLPSIEIEPPAAHRLSDLSPGQRGAVVRISTGCRGTERRRLLDLGLVPGTVVEAAFASPSGDPVAYSVRGALIAVRRRQAEMIQIQPIGEGA